MLSQSVKWWTHFSPFIKHTFSRMLDMSPKQTIWASSLLFASTLQYLSWIKSIIIGNDFLPLVRFLVCIRSVRSEKNLYPDFRTQRQIRGSLLQSLNISVANASVLSFKNKINRLILVRRQKLQRNFKGSLQIKNSKSSLL